MAKQSGSDNSGISMLALVNQVLIDGKVHSIKQISEHMQQYMFKGMSPERVQENVKLLLDHHSQVEKTPKGYRLKSGSNLTEVVREVLAEMLLPVSAKELVRRVAKKQGVPVDMIRLEPDEDDKIAVATYSSRKFYYLAKRKQVNEVIHRLLKNRNRAMTVEEIYEALEQDQGLSKADIIFLPREDKRFKKTGSKYTLKKKEKPKAAAAEPKHLVNRAELEQVVAFLNQTGNKMTAQELSATVLNTPLEQTNLRFKLARDPRIKREDDLFYYEVMEVHKQAPEKIKEKIARDYFKVKARMMGSSEIHTTAELLDRVYMVNMATQDYQFYVQVLEECLMNDDETVLLLDGGWIHKSNETRAVWKPSAEFLQVQLPSPPSPLETAKLTPAELAFVEPKDVIQVSEDFQSAEILVTAVDRKHGLIRYDESISSFFPQKPAAYEIVLDLEDEDDSFEAFVIKDNNMIRGLEMVYFERLPFEGGWIVFSAKVDKPYRFGIQLKHPEDSVQLSLKRMNELSAMIHSEWLLPDLIRELFRTSEDKFLSCYQIWTEVNLVRVASREDILATLRDYNCFLPIKSMDGFFSFDPSKGLSRLSVLEEIAKPAVKEEPVKTAAAPPVKTVEEAQKKDTAEEIAAEKKPVKAKSKQKAKKEVVRKRRKEPDVPPEELPEHLQKLKDFERRLPRLKTPARSPQSPSTPARPAKRTSRIGAVSTARTLKTKAKTPVKTTDETPVLLKPPPMPKEPQQWDTNTFVNPQRGKGYAELQTALEVLKAFVSRTPQVRRTDGSIVVFLDNNDIAVYFRIPPENQECWVAWIPEQSLDAVSNKDVWLKADGNRAKKSDNGYWWATDKFRGPKGNYRDKNVLQGVEIVGKILEMME